MPIAVNDAGDVLFQDPTTGQWNPAPTAENDSGDRVAHDGSAWVPVPKAGVEPKAEPTASAPQAPSGGIWSHLSELGKGFILGMNTTAASQLKGAAVMQESQPKTIESQIQNAQPFATGPQDAAGLENFTPRSPKENPLYQAGQAIEQRTQAEIGPNNPQVSPWARDIGSAFGSVGTSILEFGVHPMLALQGAFLQSGGEAVDNAIKAGATPDQQVRAAKLGTSVGATEYIDALIPFLGSAGAATGFLGKLGAIGRRALEGAFIEGGQEGLQQFIQNYIARSVYNPQQSLSENVARSAALGAIAGGGTAAVLGGSAAPQGPQALTPEQLDELLKSFGPAPGEDIGGGASPGSGGGPQGPQPQSGPSSTAQPGGVVTPEAQPQLPALPPPAPGTNPLTQELAHGLTQLVGPQEVDQVLVDQGLEPIHGTQGLSPRTEAPWYRPGIDATEMDPAVVAEVMKGQQAWTNNRVQALRRGDISPAEFEQAMREEIHAEPGVNAGRLAALLGPKLYGSPQNIGEVSIKEMLQNGFDAIKGVLEQGIGGTRKLGIFQKLRGVPSDYQGTINIDTDRNSRTIIVTDNGTGMTPDVLAGPFLQIAGTHKETSQSSGGLGIAKMLFLYGNQNLKVTTMRNGKVAELVSTGAQLMKALGDKNARPKITIRSPTLNDEVVFPNGHGTRVELTIPEFYTDPDTQEKRGINFPNYEWDLPVLSKSPLFHPIEVNFNGQTVAIGKNFDVQGFSRFADVKFDWGDARIYVKDEPRPRYHNVHVLSNGIWQFDTRLTVDGSPYGEPAPVEMYIDVSPRVKPEDIGYPFDLNRQNFAPSSNEGFAQILRYMSLKFQQQGLSQAADNFGAIEILDPVGGNRTVTLRPEVPKSKVDAQIESGTISVVDGQLVVKGRKIPVLSPQDMKEANIDLGELKLPQDQIDPNVSMLHDNTSVVVSALEPNKSVTEIMREKFPQRFDQYMYELGAAFHEFRAKMTELVNAAGRGEKYKDVLAGGIGVSFDPAYRGVSIRVPFTGIFLNPALPKFGEHPRLAAVSFAMTMLHEFTHHDIRTEDNPHKREMEELLVLMDVNPGIFEWGQFKQRLTALVKANWDIQTSLQEVFSGAVDVKPRNRSLKGVGDELGRDESSAGDLARTGAEGTGESGVSQGTVANAGAGGSVAQSSNVSAQSSPSGELDPYAANRAVFQRAGTPNVPPSPQQSATQRGRKSANAAFGGSAPTGVQAAAAHADRIGWFLKYFAGLHQLVYVNPRHGPLVHYYELEQQLKEIETRTIDPSVQIAKEWGSLGAEGDRLVGVMDELVNMNYLSPAERSAGIVRQPTAAEITAILGRAKVGPEGAKVLGKIRDSIRIFNGLVTQNAINRAAGNPKKIAELRAQHTLLQQRPYFPLMHFGDHYIIVRDASGSIIHAETVEGRINLTARRRQEARRKTLAAKLAPGETIHVGVLREESRPLVGMPPQLLNMIFETWSLKLTPEEINDAPILQALSLLGIKPILDPRFQRKFYIPNYSNLTPGYSGDFKRSYASYFFHGAKYLAKVQMLPQMAATVKQAEALEGSRNGYIANYMRDHFEHTIKDARGQFGMAKGFIFLWALGYSPAAATQNMMQMFLSHSWLGAKYGDVVGTKALVKAIGDQKNYYKRGKYTDIRTGVSRGNVVRSGNFFELAMAEAILAGRITESQAAELAGMSQGSNIWGSVGANYIHRKYTQLLDNSAVMFEMVEQWNRRAVFAAALELAMKYPTAKGVKEAERVFADRIRRLQTERGFSEQEAKAIAAAMYAVDQTQFVYERGVRPRFMRNRWAATVLVFKTYIQSLLFTLGTNKSDVMWRYLLTMMLLGGLAGLPLWDDLKGLLKLATRGKFDIDREARIFILDLFGGKVDPEVVLHSLARRGWGVAAFLDTVGGLFTGRPGRDVLATPKIEGGKVTGFAQSVPFPVLDRSSAVNPGSVLPVDLGAFTGEDVDRAIAQQAQKASGAVFSVGFNLIRFLADNQYGYGDVKRWERIFPRALRSATQSFRALREGRERVKGGPAGGSTLLSFDTRDPMAMAEVYGEIAAMAMGYQPTRKSARWENILAEIEVEKYYDVQKKMLYQQYWEAVKGQRQEEISSAINAVGDYNKSLPDFARGQKITGPMLHDSIKARAKAEQQREAGIPGKKNIGIKQEINRLYPGGAIDVRKAPGE